MKLKHIINVFILLSIHVGIINVSVTSATERQTHTYTDPYSGDAVDSNFPQQYNDRFQELFDSLNRAKQQLHQENAFKETVNEEAIFRRDIEQQMETLYDSIQKLLIIQQRREKLQEEQLDDLSNIISSEANEFDNIYENHLNELQPLINKREKNSRHKGKLIVRYESDLKQYKYSKDVAALSPLLFDVIEGSDYNQDDEWTAHKKNFASSEIGNKIFSYLDSVKYNGLNFTLNSKYVPNLFKSIDKHSNIIFDFIQKNYQIMESLNFLNLLPDPENGPLRYRTIDNEEYGDIFNYNELATVDTIKYYIEAAMLNAMNIHIGEYTADRLNCEKDSILISDSEKLNSFFNIVVINAWSARETMLIPIKHQWSPLCGNVIRLERSFSRDFRSSDNINNHGILIRVMMTFGLKFAITIEYGDENYAIFYLNSNSELVVDFTGKNLDQLNQDLDASIKSAKFDFFMDDIKYSRNNIAMEFKNAKPDFEYQN